MRIYVAAKTHDYRRARILMQKLRDSGHNITYDWTSEVEAVGVEHEHEAAQDKQFLVQCAERDAYGVRRAQLLVAIGHPRVCGTLVEIGMALALGKKVALVGEFPPSIFWELDAVTSYQNESEFISELNRPWSMEP